jgi:hypothetical protein
VACIGAKDAKMTDDIVNRLTYEGCYEPACNIIRGEAADEIERLRSALQKIEQAIVEEGKMPSYHRAVMKRHRQEWGTLHNAIDEALKVLNYE